MLGLGYSDERAAGTAVVYRIMRAPALFAQVHWTQRGHCLTTRLALSGSRCIICNAAASNKLRPPPPQVGEFRYLVNMVADPAPPEELPPLAAELGRSATCPLPVENPLDTPVTIAASSNNPRNFAVTPHVVRGPWVHPGNQIIVHKDVLKSLSLFLWVVGVSRRYHHSRLRRTWWVAWGGPEHVPRPGNTQHVA